MNKLVLDAWAWVEYLDGTKAGGRVREMIEGNAEVWTSLITLSEVVSRAGRSGKDGRVAASAITTLSRVGIPGLEDATQTGLLHSQLKPRRPNFSLADSYVLQLAKKLGAKVLTGDPDFKGIKEAEILS
ncbi:MAG: PIN domain-containing protein [Nitrososphaerales archaeon]|nr:PIN domain-containing protein [Nitrososphaerales archaeon]